MSENIKEKSSFFVEIDGGVTQTIEVAIPNFADMAKLH